MHVDEEYSPKTIKEAIQCFIDFADDLDFDLALECPKNKLDFLCANLEKTIIKICEIKSENLLLLEACGSKDMTPKEAAHVIIKAIWRELHS